MAHTDLIGSGNESNSPTTATAEPVFPEGWEKTFYEEKVEASLTAIRQHVRVIGEHEREMWEAIRKLLGPCLSDIGSPRRSAALSAHHSMEQIMYAFDSQMNALQSSVKTIAICSRLANEWQREEQQTDDSDE